MALSGTPEQLTNWKQNARAIFPNMPEEVFTLWLDERIEANGWPPFSSTWAGALRNHSLTTWQGITWRKEPLNLSALTLNPDTMSVVQGLIDSGIRGIPTEVGLYMGMQEIRLRMANILNFVKKNGELPSTLVFLNDGFFYDIVDGCHRLATFWALKWHPQLGIPLKDQHSVWVGYLP